MEDKMTHNNKIRTLTAGLLTGGIFALSVTFLLSPKQEFSDNENRYLAKAPTFGWEAI